MNAGTCWGKNTIDPSGRGIEKPRKATLTLTAMLENVNFLNKCNFYLSFKPNT
jgi:hypothetical protein